MCQDNFSEETPCGSFLVSDLQDYVSPLWKQIW